MRNRRTSVEAYHIFVENGILGSARRKVYEYLYKNGPTTQKKTTRYFGDRNSTISPRFAELEKMGLIEPIGITEISEETNVQNMLWDVTDSIKAKDYEKPKTQKEKIEELLSMLNNLESKVSDMFHKHDLSNIITYVETNLTKPKKK